MKIGILTFHFAYNYGAVLQAWGLQQAIESLGHEVCIINYVPPYMRKSISPLRGWGVFSGLRFPKTFSHRLLDVKRRNGIFKFSQSHLNLSHPLKSEIAVRDFCQQLDTVVVGSDQVWNLSWQQDFDATYFLGFLNALNGPKKVAYGACFGQTHQPANHLAKAIKLIQRFDAVGMRNQFGIEILKEHADIHADTVVDPAFFIPVKNPGKKKNEVIVYAVASNGAAVCAKVAEWAAHLLGGDVRQLCSESNIRLPKNFKSTREAAPDQWVNRLANSAFVCSESFHGAVFALANRIPFISASGKGRSERILDLLARYGVINRFLEKTSDFHPEMLHLHHDYYPKLQADIVSSRNFLERVL